MEVNSGVISGRSSKGLSGLGESGSESSSAHKGSDKGRDWGGNHGRE